MVRRQNAPLRVVTAAERAEMERVARASSEPVDRVARARPVPDREQDGTATWSLTTLQRALRRAPDGLPGVSTWTILRTLWDAGYSWQARRTWCPTGTAQRKRTDGTVVAVTDPDTTPKQTPSSRRTSSAKRSASRSGIRTRRVRTKRSRSRDRLGSPPRNRRVSRRSTSGAGP